jgi:uncharacterized membrane protein YvlD (DUF360 family)
MPGMAKLLLWCILFALCWPLALLVLAIVPVMWLISLPFRILGFVLHGVFSLAWVAFCLWFVWMVVTLPFRWFSHGRMTGASAVL